jgi:ClpP class serine protease
VALNDYWWIALLFIGLQPVIRQKALEARRLRVLKRLEQARRSRVIALVHRQETMSLLGFPLMRYIDVNDSEEVYDLMRLFPQPTRTRPSVEYVPLPYTRPEKP